ncbi:MAG: hypothetical protein OK439_02820 [Thaumarchaeota archaeon]|nr:hypothetical protein [Nitrososphaerota archaeon]
MVFDQIERLKSAFPDFQEALDTYLQQYGKSKLSLSDPIKLTESIDPVVIIFGRNCAITYSDSIKLLSGSQGRLNIRLNEIYIFGRRQPQDSKLLVWSKDGPMELEEYNSRVDTIPSRVHGVLANLEDGTFYSDLGSSAGTILAGQSRQLGGAFVRIYDPGSRESPTIRSDRIFSSRKSPEVN